MTDALRWMPVTLCLRTWRRVLWLLLVTLLCVQTVGVLHRVAHAKQSKSVTAHAVSHTTGSMAGIWGEHSNSAECQLFDQTCPDLLQLPVWALPTSLPLTLWTDAARQERFALVERFYAARGPPAALL